MFKEDGAKRSVLIVQLRRKSLNIVTLSSMFLARRVPVIKALRKIAIKRAEISDGDVSSAETLNLDFVCDVN